MLQGKLHDALAVLAYARRMHGMSSATMALSIDTKVQLRLWSEAVSDLEALRAVRPRQAAHLEAEYHLDEYEKLRAADTVEKLKQYLAGSPPQPWRDVAEEKHDALVMAEAGDGAKLEGVPARLLSQHGKEIAERRLAAWRAATWQRLVDARLSCSYLYKTVTYDARIETTVYGSGATTRYVPASSDSYCDSNTVTVSLVNRHSSLIRGTVSLGYNRSATFELAAKESRALTLSGDCGSECSSFFVSVVGGEKMP